MCDEVGSKRSDNAKVALVSTCGVSLKQKISAEVSNQISRAGRVFLSVDLRC